MTQPRKPVQIALLLIALAIVAGYCYSAKRPHSQPTEQPKVTLPAPPAYADSGEEQLYRFLALHMTDPHGGLHTNLRQSPQEVQGNTVTGHAVLSESVGLLMEYAVLSQNRELFDLQTDLLRQRFVKEDFIRWVIPSPGNPPATAVNASLDDLRIIRALLEASVPFQKKGYQLLALELAAGLREHNEQDGFLLDYSSFDRTSRAPSVQVRYLDLATLATLGQLDKAYQPIYEQSLRVHRQALQPSGLYATAYLPDRQAFQPENGRIAVTPNMSEQLVAALHAQAAGLPVEGMRGLLHRTLTETGRLYATVTYEGSPATATESPAVYALAARFLQRAGEADLAKKCLQRLRDLQVEPQQYAGSPAAIRQRADAYRGGFVDLHTESAYSFDQLQALLAFRELGALR